MRNVDLVSWALVVAEWELDDGGDETFVTKCEI
jgi:hypothetical protein